MVFTKRLRDGVRRGRIKCSVRIWKHLQVKVGGRYPMDEGHVVIDSVVSMQRSDITEDLARESGFDSLEDLLQTAQHGTGSNIYLIRFHYLPPGAWDMPRATSADRKDNRTEPGTAPSRARSQLLHRIRASAPPASAKPAPARPRRKRGA